ncbi:hypothetical protein [Sporomusa aerivorans]|uniref:hypothetical protein n=1 Tax=Sporomusa aerivorans TaxID=204936 RepID=UPI00352A89B5
MDVESLTIGLENEELDKILFESRFVNVKKKDNDLIYRSIVESYGLDKIHDNGLQPRSFFEISCGLSVIKKLGIEIIAPIYNLPFTVAKRRKPAQTAFADCRIERRHIYLVPDHTTTRILDDQEFHISGIEMLQGDNEIEESVAEKWIREIQKLDVGHRVAGSILHEQGHILTFDAMDKTNISSQSALFKWLDAYGYLDNCSERIVLFSQLEPSIMINTALESLAEDYRLSHFVKSCEHTCCLPHSLSYVQDILYPEKFLKGVEIMKELLSKRQLKAAVRPSTKGSLEAILPFGEAQRCDSMRCYSHGKITPLTKEDKAKALEKLQKLECL